MFINDSFIDCSVLLLLLNAFGKFILVVVYFKC